MPGILEDKSMQLQLLHLYYFKLLAENEHLLNTAKQIHISPPALSSTISKLEHELNVSLFNRIGRHIKLNRNGEILYRHVCNIFAEIDQIEQELCGGKIVDQKIISVGVTAMTLWNTAIGNFMFKNPGIIVNQSVMLVDTLNNKEYTNLLDFIITDEHDITDRNWEPSLIFEDGPVLLVNSRHKFAGRKTVSLAEAADENFIALSKGYSSRKYFDYACSKAGFTPKICAEVDYMLRSQLILNGIGISFSSELGYKALSNPDIKRVKIDSDTPSRRQCIFSKKSAELSAAAKEFRDYIIHCYK